MPFIYSNGKYNKAGNLIYNDNGTNKRVMYAYIGDGTEYGCIFRLNGTACTLQREGCPLQTGSFNC